MATLNDVMRGNVCMSTPWRIILTMLLAATFVYTFILLVLASFGKPPFSQSTGAVSHLLLTCITPAEFTFLIWYTIYLFILWIVIYAIILLCGKVGDIRAWKLGGPVSILFLVFLIIAINLCLGWLFAWDSFNTLGSALILLFTVLAINIALILALYSFSKDGANIYQKSKFHFWSGILVINGVGLYYGYAVIALLINIAVYFQFDVGLGSIGLCLGLLIFLLVIFILWFIIENTVLVVFGNPLITHYVALVWIMIGIHEKQKGISSDEVWALIITVLVVGVLLLVFRIILLIYRNWNNAIYGKPSQQNSS